MMTSSLFYQPSCSNLRAEVPISGVDPSTEQMLAEVIAIDIAQARVLFSTEPSRPTTPATNTSSNSVIEALPSVTAITTTVNASSKTIDELQQRNPSVPLYVTVFPVAAEPELTVNRPVIAETQQAFGKCSSYRCY